MQKLRQLAVRTAAEVVADRLASGFDVDAEQWLSTVHAAADADPNFQQPTSACPRIFCCIPTYKRTWQLVKTLPINLTLAWKYRHLVSFVLADLNEDLDADPALEACEVALERNFLMHYRRLAPESDGWTGWHASVGKNCAHIAALDAAGKQPCILVELDNDNFVSDQFFEDIIACGEDLAAHRLTGLRWRHPNCPPTTGRTMGGDVVAV